MEPQSTYECEWCVDGLQADGETPCPCQEADLPRQVRDLKRALAEANEKIANYEEVLADKRRLAREIDVALHGEEGAAKQPSLCDLIEPARKMREKADQFERERDEAIEAEYAAKDVFWSIYPKWLENGGTPVDDELERSAHDRRATTAEARAERLEKALRLYAGVCDATETHPCGYEGNMCCMTARAALQQAAE